LGRLLDAAEIGFLGIAAATIDPLVDTGLDVGLDSHHGLIEAIDKGVAVVSVFPDGPLHITEAGGGGHNGGGIGSHSIYRTAHAAGGIGQEEDVRLGGGWGAGFNGNGFMDLLAVMQLSKSQDLKVFLMGVKGTLTVR
jgi:hypothetical protein